VKTNFFHCLRALTFQTFDGSFLHRQLQKNGGIQFKALIGIDGNTDGQNLIFYGKIYNEDTL
jgi:hypothetical protein